MTKQPKGPLALSILIIAVGVGWLLTAQGFGAGVDWLWTILLGTVGVLTFVLSGGVDKVSVVIGPFFLVTSVLSILRQRQMISVDVEIPIMVILIGVLLFFAQMGFVPAPGWLTPLTVEPERKKPN
jgi:hypothetical protein